MGREPPSSPEDHTLWSMEERIEATSLSSDLKTLLKR